MEQPIDIDAYQKMSIMVPTKSARHLLHLCNYNWAQTLYVPVTSAKPLGEVHIFSLVGRTVSLECPTLNPRMNTPPSLAEKQYLSRQKKRNAAYC